MFNTRQPAGDLTIVRFLKNDLPYMRDECAGFARAHAEMLVRKGYAELVGAPKPTGGRVPEPEGSGVLTPPGVVGPASR